MTREEIIAMAIEAGGSSDDPSNLLTIGILERFAALVAAHERRQFAAIAEAFHEQKYDSTPDMALLQELYGVDDDR